MSRRVKAEKSISIMNQGTHETREFPTTFHISCTIPTFRFLVGLQMRWKSGDGRGGEGNLYDEGQEFPQVSREGEMERRCNSCHGRTALAETRVEGERERGATDGALAPSIFFRPLPPFQRPKRDSNNLLLAVVASAIILHA